MRIQQDPGIFGPGTHMASRQDQETELLWRAGQQYHIVHAHCHFSRPPPPTHLASWTMTRRWFNQLQAKVCTFFGRLSASTNTSTAHLGEHSSLPTCIRYSVAGRGPRAVGPGRGMQLWSLYVPSIQFNQQSLLSIPAEILQLPHTPYHHRPKTRTRCLSGRRSHPSRGARCASAGSTRTPTRRSLTSGVSVTTSPGRSTVSTTASRSARARRTTHPTPFPPSPTPNRTSTLSIPGFI